MTSWHWPCQIVFLEWSHKLLLLAPSPPCPDLQSVSPDLGCDAPPPSGSCPRSSTWLRSSSRVPPGSVGSCSSRLPSSFAVSHHGDCPYHLSRTGQPNVRHHLSHTGQPNARHWTYSNFCKRSGLYLLRSVIKLFQAV